MTLAGETPAGPNREMYDFFQKQGFTATPEAVARHTTLLGHAPRSFEAFAEETAAAWKG